jgi:hypothetical protein
MYTLGITVTNKLNPLQTMGEESRTLSIDL